MPQYELMYLLASTVADDEVPKISSQMLKSIEDLGGSEVKETLLGKKKLSFPIKRTRNGHYVVVNFSMPGTKVNELDAKIRTQDSTIIRYILVNLDEHLERQEKDRVAQSKIVRRIPVEPALEAPTRKEKIPAAPLIEINQEELDKKIEEALSEDLTK